MSITTFYIILGVIIGLFVLAFVTILWIIPRVRQHFKDKFTPTTRKAFIRVKEGNSWIPHEAYQVGITPGFTFYAYDVKTGEKTWFLTDKTKRVEVGISNQDSVEWEEGGRAISVYPGESIGYSPSTAEKVASVNSPDKLKYWGISPAAISDPYKSQALYSIEHESIVAQNLEESVQREDKGAETRLMIMVMIMVFVIAVVAVIYIFNKPGVTNNIYTNNATAIERIARP